MSQHEQMLQEQEFEVNPAQLAREINGFLTLLHDVARVVAQAGE